MAGDDEELVRRTAHEVDSQMKELVSKHKTLADDKALPVLTALNIAEARILESQATEKERSFVVDELEKMTDTLKQYLDKHV